MSVRPVRSGAETPDGDKAGFSILEWDSEKFGFPIARVRRGTCANDLQLTIERMRSLGVVLAYYSAPESSQLTDSDARDLGATLIDVRLTLVHRSVALNVASSDPLSSLASRADLMVESYRREEAESDLVELARAAGRFSRFRVDPRIDAAVFRDIYDAWLTRSIRREIADEVYVARVHSHPVGLLTLGVAGGRGTIGLLSVHESVRRRGVGRLLADLAAMWSAARGLHETQVVTQLANRPACALYEAAGYAIESREPTYHIWLR